jgi:hypothetical protein
MWSAFEYEVPLVHQILKPFIEEHVAVPTTIQFNSTRAVQAAKGGVPPLSVIPHCLGEGSVEIDPHYHVWIRNALAILEEKVGKAERHCVTTSIDDFDVQIAIAGNLRLIVAIKPIDIWYELLQP